MRIFFLVLNLYRKVFFGSCLLLFNHLTCRLIREIGGVCIADEVQTALGRTGEYFLASEVCLLCVHRNSHYN